MDCKETKTWLHGYVDGELDLARTMEIESHLETCATCARTRDNQHVLHDSIQAGDLSWRCPDRLRTNIESLVYRELGRPNSRPNIPRWWPNPFPPSCGAANASDAPRRVIATAVVNFFMVGLLFGWRLVVVVGRSVRCRQLRR